MKKFLALLMAAMMVLSACCVAMADGTNLSTESDGSETVSGNYTPEDGAVIEVFTIKTEVVGVMDEIIELYKAEYPQVTVNHTYGQDGETVLATRIASNDMPTITQVYPFGNNYQAYYDAGYLMDLTNEPFLANLGGNILNLTEYKGIQYCLPMTVSTYGIYYRADLFKAAGIENAPTTYEEFLADLELLKASGIEAPVAFPYKGDANQLTERIMGSLNPDCPADFQAVADGEKEISASDTINAFAKFLDDIKPYATPDALGMDRDSALQDVVNGTSALMFNGSWLLSQFLTADPDIDIAYCAIPSPLVEPAKTAVNCDSAWSISATTEYPEAAKAFVEFLSTTPIAQKYYEVDGNINYVKGVAYDKVQLMSLYDNVMGGNAFNTVGNLWPTWDLRADLAAASQGYYDDGDIEAYYEACAEYIDFYYHR